MSQQEMQFENTGQGPAKAYESGYETLPRYNNDYGAGHYNQKLTEPGTQSTPENAHLKEHMLNLRMGMAVFSLILWMGLFLISLAILLRYPATPIIQSFIFMGLGVFTVFVILANMLINRK